MMQSPAVTDTSGDRVKERRNDSRSLHNPESLAGRRRGYRTLPRSSRTLDLQQVAADSVRSVRLTAFCAICTILKEVENQGF
jgi:hypothetical protein